GLVGERESAPFIVVRGFFGWFQYGRYIALTYLNAFPCCTIPGAGKVGQMTSERIAILGAGGHATVIVATLRAMGRQVSAIFDDSPDNRRHHVLGIPVC